MGTVLASSFLGARAQSKAASKQAKGIKNAQAISQKAAQQARSDALSLFDPAFRDISTSLQQARDDIITGRQTSQDILSQAFSQSSNALQTSQQQALNAILGTPQQAPQQVPQQAQAPAKPIRPGDFARAAPAQTSGLREQLPQATGAPPQTNDFSAERRIARKFGPSSAIEQVLAMNEVQPQQAGSDLGGASAPLEQLTGGFGRQDLPQAAQQATAPQGEYGLAGAERALLESLGAQEGALTQGYGDAFNTVGQGFDQARGDVTGQLGAGLGALRAGVATGRGDISSARDAAIGYLDPYESTGQQALQREAALSGALGSEAQAEAFASYNESPGQKYFRDQQERSLLRNSAALGQTGSGNVLTALQEQAQGIASQNYQQDLENLRSLAGRGQQAATTQGGYQQQAGQSLANLAFQGGAAELGARQQAGSTLAQLAANRGLTQGQLQQGLGQSLSNIYGQVGGQVSGLRNQAGRDIAGQISAGGQQQANLINQLGGNLANIDQQTAANIANLAAQQGQSTSGLRTGLAALLANLATGQGSQQASLATQLGGAQAAGVTNPIGNAINTGLGLFASNPGMFNFGGSVPNQTSQLRQGFGT